MKIGIFTDSHYSSQEITCRIRHNSRSLEKIRQAYRFFEREQCDLVVCLGDLIDKESCHEKEVENLKKAASVINGSPIKTMCLMGNHDAFAFTEAEFYGILGIPKPCHLQLDGKELLFLDACHFHSGNHYLPGDSDWTDTFYPHTDALREQIRNAVGDVYIFVHQNLDPAVKENHRLRNAEEINEIFFTGSKVNAVYQGHYHPGCRSNHNGVHYVTFPAMCENESACFIEEI